MRAIAALLALAALTVAATVACADAGREGERYVSVAWDTAPNERGRKIEVRYSYRGWACQYRFHRATARETDRTVTIKVLAHWRPMRKDEACIAIAGGGRTTVKLRRPLGNRKLRHAPVTDPGATP